MRFPLVLAATLFCTAVQAQPKPDATDVATDAPAPGGSLWSRPNLVGDPGGVRGALAARGVTLGLVETAEVLGNVSGGVRRGAVFEGVAQVSLVVDTEKAFGLPGGTFNVSAFQIHGRGLSLNALNGNINTVSSLEAERGTLLDELWYEQSLFNDRLSIRLGQLAADTEFMTSQYAAVFVNHTFGWATFPSVDLPSGGPSFPLATPGIRLKAKPTGALTVMLGAFNGDPAGPGTGSPQTRNPSGTRFRLNDGLLALLEVQYAVNQGPGASGLPGTYKLGAYWHDGSFADQRRNAAGMSVNDPLATDQAFRRRRGNYGIYAVADQRVWRPAGEGDSGVGVFARVMGGPGDRNLLNFYADFGATWKGALLGRPDDTAGIGFAVARYSDTASALDGDAALSGSPAPLIRRHESVLELTYQAQLAPWWQVQPNAQYVFNINGGVEDPRRPGRRVNDALVLGLRTAITF